VVQIKTSWALIIVLAAAVLLGGGAIFWYYYKVAPDMDIEVDIVSPIKVSKKATTTDSTTTNETKDWKTYTNDIYGVTFKYPKNWTTKTESVKSGDGPILVDYDIVSISTGDKKYYISEVDISKYSDYKKTSDYDYEADVEKIKKVYSTKSLVGTEKLMLPPVNATVMASNTPNYIQTSDAKYRGIYYFANIGQDVSTMLDCVIILTDGTSNIIQFHFAMLSDKLDVDSNRGTIDSQFSNYVQSLNTNSNETIVENFNIIYKQMALSVK